MYRISFVEKFVAPTTKNEKGSQHHSLERILFPLTDTRRIQISPLPTIFKIKRLYGMAFPRRIDPGLGFLQKQLALLPVCFEVCRD